MWKKPLTQSQIKDELMKLRNSSNILCLQCGIKLHKEFNYCPNCGNGAEKLFDEPSVKYALICKVCHEEIAEPFSKYCTNCGNRIRKAVE